MRYFVTGGAGFIGSNYVRHLFNEVPDFTGVTIYDKFTYAANPLNFAEFVGDPRLLVVKGDICDFELLEESMAGHDYVIHFAAESHVDRSIKGAEVFIQTNVVGSHNVFEAARKNRIRTVIHVSTDEVYGSISTGFATEESPLQPNSPYAASKASSDLIARSFFKTYDLDVRITRCSNNFGPNQYPEKFIPLVILSFFGDRNVPVYGNGENRREWIYVDRHCRQISKVLAFGAPGEIYNIGNGNEYSNLEIIEKLRGIIPETQSRLEFVKDRLGHDFRYSIASKKLNEKNEANGVTFEDELVSTVSWYKDNQNRFNGL